jgi:hypothetical protein
MPNKKSPPRGNGNGQKEKTTAVSVSPSGGDVKPGMTITLDKEVDSACIVLIKSGNEAKTRDGRLMQTIHAAYIDGYITAADELSRCITHLWQTDKATARTVYNALHALRTEQDKSFNVMIKRLNDAKTWDEGSNL